MMREEVKVLSVWIALLAGISWLFGWGGILIGQAVLRVDGIHDSGRAVPPAVVAQLDEQVRK